MNADIYCPDTDSEDDEFESDDESQFPKSDNLGIVYGYSGEMSGLGRIDGGYGGGGGDSGYGGGGGGGGAGGAAVAVAGAVASANVNVMGGAGFTNNTFIHQQQSQQLQKQIRVQNLLNPMIIKIRVLHFTNTTSSSYLGTIDLNEHVCGILDNVIGISLVSALLLNTDQEPAVNIGTFTPFVDLYVPEIPLICTKSTNTRSFKPLIARIPLNLNDRDWSVYKDDRPFVNYFNPITISKLTLELYKKKSIFTSNTLYGHYEFEFSILNPSYI